jgi:hypothetical protein
MTKQMKASLSVAAVLAGGVLVYNCWRFLKTPTAGAAPPSSSAKRPGTAPLAGYSAAPVISDVDLVKNGTIPEYKSTTVSRAFEGAFQDPAWQSVVNLQGQRVVAFHGTVKYAVLKEAGFYIGTWNGVRQGIEAERQISEDRHQCFVAAGQSEPSTPDDSLIGPCMAKAYESIVIPVSFEFTLSPDKKGVEMTLPDSVFQKFDSDHRLRKERDATLAFIYQ